MTQMASEKPKNPKRFYREVAVAEAHGGLAIALDGRIAKTRAGAPLATASQALAQALRDEWDRQEEEINLTSMRLTRLLTTTIDRASVDRPFWEADIVKYLGSDLLCYRAESPAALVARQAAQWDPLLARLESETGLTLATTSGVGFIEQSPDVLAKAGAELTTKPSEAVLALKSIAEILGSGALALLTEIDPSQADEFYRASRLDEEFQIERWGRDAEAEARDQARREDFLSIVEFMRLI